MAQEQQLRDQGLLPDEDEDTPIELAEGTQRLARLFHQDEQRRQARLRNEPPPGPA